MPEIGLGKGAGVGSFASGFGKGLSQALLTNRQRSDEKEQEARARKDRLFQTMLPVLMQNMEDPADLQPLLESQFPDIFTQGKKGGKKGQGPWDKLAGFLGPLVGMNKGRIGNDLPEQGGISGMLGREPGPFGTQPTSVGASPLGGALPPSTQPTGVSGGTLGNRPVYGEQQGGATGGGYGLRPDGTPKGEGFLGPQRLKNGSVASEYSIGTTDVNGTEMDIPTLVPTLTPDEIQATLRAAEAGTSPPASVIAKAVAHAKQRLAQGKSVFAGPGEQQGGGLAQGLLRDVPPDISQTPFAPGAKPAAPATPAHRTLFGVPVLSREEKAQREADAEIAGLKRTIEARRNVATGLGMDPAKAIDFGLYGTRPPAGGMAGSRFAGVLKGDQAGPGEKDVYGRPLDPNMYYRAQLGADQELTYTPTQPPGTSNAGQDYNRAAIMMGYRSAAEVPADKRAELEATAGKLAGNLTEAQGMGRGRAEIATELEKPIGPTAAGLYNVPPTTTLKQLQDVQTLRPDQQEKIASLGQIDALLDGIEADLPKVFPDVQPGIWGRLQTQFSLGAQKLGASADLAELDATINAALAQVAQLSGQPGSRLSDRDIELAKSTLANLSPSIFGGDTLATAKARLAVLKGLLSKAQTSVVTQAGRPTPAQAAPTGPPGMTNRNGILYGADGKELPGQRGK